MDMMRSDKKLNGEECKQCLLDLLTAFDKLCEHYQLTYFLMWGTLIGAVRHKGFIPWDDDIDVAMPREDYKKLIIIASQDELDAGFICHENNNEYPLFWGKFYDKTTRIDCRYTNNISGLGLFLDVFPLDKVSPMKRNSINGVSKALLKNEKMLNYANTKRFWPSDNLGRSIIKFVVYSYSKMQGIQYWQKKRRNILDKYFVESDKENNEYCLCGSWFFSAEWFAESILLPLETCNFPCPIGYDAILRERYGDYMKLPPKEKQISNHDYEVYWIG